MNAPAVAPIGGRRPGVVERARDRSSRIEVAAVAVALVPIVAAIVRKWAQHWVPIGDNALVELRSRDVFSFDDFPFLGTWSSASLTAGKDLNHPGPLLFVLLALPVKLFGGPRGVALGVGLINAAAVVGIALVGRRVRGQVGLLSATFVAAVLAWTLGSAMLTDPWNPHVLILPCLLLFVLVWGVACGHVDLLPWLVAVGSLCLQTHLGYTYLVPAMTIAALAGAAVVYVRSWRIHPVRRDDDLATLRRWGWRSAAVFVVLWSPPILEQVVGEGQGNLARIVTSAGGDEPAVGARVGVRIVASVVAMPPWWGRSSFMEAVPYTPYAADGVTIDPAGLPSFAGALVAVGLVFAVLGVMVWRAGARRDRPGVVAPVVAAVGLVAALSSLVVMPVGPLGLTPHQMRWLWPLAAFVVLAVLVALAPIVARVPVVAVAPRRVALVAFGAIAVVSAVNVPGFAQLAGPDSFQESVPVGRALSEQIGDYRSTEPMVLDTTGLRYLEPYSAVVMSALLREGVDLRVREEGLVRQLGNDRRSTGVEPLDVSLVEGRAALEPPVDSEVIAFTSPLDASSIDALLQGERAMIDSVALNGVSFTEDGERAIAGGQFGLIRDEIVEAAFDAPTFVLGGLAAELVAAGALELEPADVSVFQQTSALRRMVDATTVAVVVRPS